MANAGFNSIDERLMFANHKNKVSGDMREGRNESRRESESEGSSIRDQALAANQQKSIRAGQKASKNVAKLKMAALKKKAGIDKLEKKGVRVIMNELWIFTASIVGFIPGAIGLNAMVAASFFSSKVKLRLGDKIGIIILDILIAFLFALFIIIVVGVVAIISNWAVISKIIATKSAEIATDYGLIPAVFQPLVKLLINFFK